MQDRDPDIYRMQLEAICNNATVALFITDEHRHCVYMNPAAERLTGYTLSEIKGRAMHDVVHHTRPDGRPYPSAACPIHQAFPGNDREQGEEVFIHKNGTFYPIAFAVSPIRGEGAVVGTVVEVRSLVDGRRAAEALADERALLNTVLETAPVGFALFDLDLRYLMINRRLAEINGLPPEAHLGRTVGEIVPSLEPEVRQILEHIRATGRPVINHELVGETASSPGEFRYWSESWFPVNRTDGQLSCIAAIVEEVTDRKRAEQRLREAEHFNRRIVQSSLSGIYLCDLATGRVKYINPMYTRITGHTLATLDEIAPHAILALVHPDDRMAITAHLEDIRRASDGDVFEIEFRLRRADGQWIWCLSRDGIFDRDAQGGVRHLIGSLRDISARKKAEEALRAKTRQLESLLISAPLGVTYFDREHRFLQVNEELAAVNGIPVADHIGRTVEEVLPVNARVVGPAIDRVFTTGETVRDLEVSGETPREPGVRRYWLTGFYPVRDQNGEVVMVGAWVTEITGRKRAEHALREADRRKDEYLATLAHELRNPLAPLRNSVELLRMIGGDDSRQGPVLEMMERQVAHMVRLIDDLLDASRLATGKLHIANQSLDLAHVVRSAVVAARPIFASRALQLDVQVCSSPVRVNGDPIRLDQVVTNLLTNAAKFTEPDGRVLVSLAVDGSDAILRVQDTGIGIPSDKLESIFDLFAQIHLPGSDHFHAGGLGIGLNLAKRLIELHHGTIRASSGGVGHGSEFVVTLPLAVEAEPVRRPTSSTIRQRAAQPVRILVVDDNQDAADSLAFLLECRGHDVVKTYDGPSAIRLAEAHRPDVVLLDLAMPGMTGYEVASVLRAQAGSRPRIVAMSGFGDDASRRRSNGVGFDAHLVKPVTLDALTALIDECREKRERASDRNAPVRT